MFYSHSIYIKSHRKITGEKLFHIATESKPIQIELSLSQSFSTTRLLNHHQEKRAEKYFLAPFCKLFKDWTSVKKEKTPCGNDILQKTAPLKNTVNVNI